MPDGHAVALKYVRSGAILTDLLTILPTILQVKHAHAPHGPAMHQLFSLDSIKYISYAVIALRELPSCCDPILVSKGGREL